MSFTLHSRLLKKLTRTESSPTRLKGGVSGEYAVIKLHSTHRPAAAGQWGTRELLDSKGMQSYDGWIPAFGLVDKLRTTLKL